MLNVQSYHLYLPESDGGRIVRIAKMIDAAIRLTVIPFNVAAEDEDKYQAARCRQLFKSIDGGAFYLDFMGPEFMKAPGVGRMSFSKSENMFGLAVRFDVRKWGGRTFESVRREVSPKLQEALAKVHGWLRKRGELINEDQARREFNAWVCRFDVLCIDAPPPQHLPPYDETLEMHKKSRKAWREGVIAATLRSNGEKPCS